MRGQGWGLVFFFCCGTCRSQHTHTNWRHANKELNKLYLPKFYSMCVGMVWRRCAGQVITLHWISTPQFALFLTQHRRTKQDRANGTRESKREWDGHSKSRKISNAKWNHRWRKLKAANKFIHFCVEWQPASTCFHGNELKHSYSMRIIQKMLWAKLLLEWAFYLLFFRCDYGMRLHKYQSLGVIFILFGFAPFTGLICVLLYHSFAIDIQIHLQLARFKSNMGIYISRGHLR